MSSLRRFVAPLPEAVTGATEKPKGAPPGEACEMCTTPIPESGPAHAHVVDAEHHRLMCTCRPCMLLFVPQGAAMGRYRAVPDRYLHDPAFALTGVQWEALGIPVGMVFVFRSNDQWVAFYPSPAGATESLLNREAWDEVAAANPGLVTLEPDVEALLLARSDEAFEGFVVPIDRCYELVGLVRMYWKGFDGGEEARAQVDLFFSDLRARSLPLSVEALR